MFHHQDLQIAGLKLNKINVSNFYPLEVVTCGSHVQLQVGENLNYLIIVKPSQKISKYIMKTPPSGISINM